MSMVVCNFLSPSPSPLPSSVLVSVRSLVREQLVKEEGESELYSASVPPCNAPVPSVLSVQHSSKRFFSSILLLSGSLNVGGVRWVVDFDAAMLCCFLDSPV